MYISHKDRYFGILAAHSIPNQNRIGQTHLLFNLKAIQKTKHHTNIFEHVQFAHIFHLPKPNVYIPHCKPPAPSPLTPHYKPFRRWFSRFELNDPWIARQNARCEWWWKIDFARIYLIAFRLVSFVVVVFVVGLCIEYTCRSFVYVLYGNQCV